MTVPALIACDVDGTLFDDDETITPRTREAVRGAVAGGAHFILATGIGKVEVVNTVSGTAVIEAVEEIKRLSNPR